MKLFSKKSTVEQRMAGYCEGRPILNVDELVCQFQQTRGNFSRIKFKDFWTRTASTLKYPDPGLMRLDDDLYKLISIHNCGRIHEAFEDIYEILQAIDITAFHLAIDAKTPLAVVADLLSVFLKTDAAHEAVTDQVDTVRDPPTDM